MPAGSPDPVILRIIGDVHGHYRQYLELVKHVPYSIQLGDFGFDYKCLDEVDPLRHKILLGNHENYERIPQHSLGDYGLQTLGDFTFFFIRGAYSIDVMYRTPYVSWWPTEQLSTAKGEDCVKAFDAFKPDLVLSHDCPLSVYPQVIANPWFIQENWTSRFLEECLQHHQPARWVFGHHHRKWTDKLGATRFRCLGELEVMDFFHVPGNKNAPNKSS